MARFPGEINQATDADCTIGNLNLPSGNGPVLVLAHPHFADARIVEPILPAQSPFPGNGISRARE